MQISVFKCRTGKTCADKKLLSQKSAMGYQNHMMVLCWPHGLGLATHTSHHYQLTLFVLYLRVWDVWKHHIAFFVLIFKQITITQTAINCVQNWTNNSLSTRFSRNRKSISVERAPPLSGRTRQFDQTMNFVATIDFYCRLKKCGRSVSKYVGAQNFVSACGSSRPSSELKMNIPCPPDGPFGLF